MNHVQPLTPMAETPILEGLMDARTAAAFLGLSILTLSDWRVKGTGPVFVKCGGSVRYLRSDLDAWIMSNRKGA